MSFKLKSLSENKYLFIDLIDPEYIQVKIESKDVSICHKSFLYTDGNALKNLFKEMAVQWKGWPSDKRWASVEGDVSIIATFNLTGNVSLNIKLVHNLGSDDWWEFQTIFIIENSQLEDLEKQMSKL